MSTPSVRPTLSSMGWHDTAALLLQIQRMVLLVGRPGIGKSAWAVEQARRWSGVEPEVLQGSPERDASALWGLFLLEGDRTRFVDGPLPRALRSGAVLLVEEINLLPLEARAELLALREASVVTNPFTGERLPISERFRLLATSNPESLQCDRMGDVAEALIDGCLVLDVPDLNVVQVTDLLRQQHQSANEVHIDQVAKAWVAYQDLGDPMAKPPARLSYRAADQCLRLLMAGLELRQAVRVAMVNKYASHEKHYQTAQQMWRLGRGMGEESDFVVDP
ncbi:hypothetical protein LBMAG53_38260 [Planctomycetota bacterium]|nr:hypothetical protein LBMAG53_38260 [Planctomycetota bacterium]